MKKVILLFSFFVLVACGLVETKAQPITITSGYFEMNYTDPLVFDPGERRISFDISGASFRAVGTDVNYGFIGGLNYPIIPQYTYGRATVTIGNNTYQNIYLTYSPLSSNPTTLNFQRGYYSQPVRGLRRPSFQSGTGFNMSGRISCFDSTGTQVCQTDVAGTGDVTLTFIRSIRSTPMFSRYYISKEMFVFDEGGAADNK